MDLDLREFVTAIRQTEVKSDIDLPVVSDYVMKHIYEPLRRDEKVRFAELDFEAFSEEDIHELNELMEAYSHIEHRLIQLSRRFCETETSTVQHRAFC